MRGTGRGGRPDLSPAERRQYRPQADELTAGAAGASYRPLFGEGDKDARQLKGIARYGELTLAPGGRTATVSHPAEEQLYYILEGEGTLLYEESKSALRANDFLYLPPGVRHSAANSSTAPLRLLVMGFRIPAGVKVAAAPKPMIANADEVALQVLASHGPTTQFKLLMGTTESKRDRLAAANRMVSLFIMDFAPGGTNIPHHHDRKRKSITCSGEAATWWRAAERTATRGGTRRARATHGSSG